MHSLRTRGFTLIELLVVIAIIGLLSSVVLASLNVARGKALDVQRASNLRNVQQALELYASNNSGKYPISTGDTPPAWSSPCPGWEGIANYIPGLVPTYIGSLPKDSKEDDTPGNYKCCYMYKSDAAGANYKLFFHNCAGNSNSVKSLIDPAFANFADGTNIEWSVYTIGAAGWQ